MEDRDGEIGVRAHRPDGHDRPGGGRWTRERVARALEGDPLPSRELVEEISRVIRVRVARRLRRSGLQRRLGEGRLDVEDLCQDVLAYLLERDGRVLRSWDPDRGLSLANFVGLAAERLVGGRLRAGGPQLETATDVEALGSLHEDGRCASTPVRTIEARDTLDVVRRALAARISGRGMTIYRLLFLEQRGVAEVAERLSLGAGAVYAWRSRIRKHLRRIEDQLAAAQPRRWSPRRDPAAA